MKKDLSKYQLTKKEAKKLNKELKKIIRMKGKELVAFLRHHRERPT